MKCANCGSEIAEGSKFCETCGTPVAAPAPEAAPIPEAPAAPEAVVYEAPKAPETVAAAAAANTVSYSAPAAPVSNKKNIWSLILGIAGLGSCWLGVFGLFGLISIAISIVGLCIGGKAKKAANANKMAKTGWILSLIGLILGIILTIIFTIAWIAGLRYYSKYY